MELYAEVDSKVSISKLSRSIRALGAEIESIQIDRNYAGDGSLRALVIAIRPLKKANRQELLAQLQDMEGILYLEEL